MLGSKLKFGLYALLAGIVLGSAGTLWIAGRDLFERGDSTRWRTRIVEARETEASKEWETNEVDCPGSGPVRFRKPSRDETLRLVREYGFDPRDLGLEPRERVVEVPGEIQTIVDRVEVPSTDFRLFGEIELASLPFGGKGVPYLDSLGNFRLRQKANDEPTKEAPLLWSLWARVGYSVARLDPGSLPGIDPETLRAVSGLPDPDPGLALAVELRLELARYRRLVLAPYVEAGRKPGLKGYVEGGLALGLAQKRFRFLESADVEIPSR